MEFDDQRSGPPGGDVFGQPHGAPRTINVELPATAGAARPPFGIAGIEPGAGAGGREVTGGAVDMLSLVGNTPLLRLARIARETPGVEIYAKAEWFNPGGSVKDRAALNIVREAERTGRMGPGKVLVDSTSGNTGIAYAMICAARGYRVKLFMPANVSSERKRILHAYGAEVIYTDPMQGSDGAIHEVRELMSREPEGYFYANQYDNPANWQAHYFTTGREILAQTAGRATHFVAALGTSGTFMGATRRLKEVDPAIRCLSVQPDSPFHGLEGLKHMPSAIPPGIYDPGLADANLTVATEEAYAATLRLAREEGLLVGVSSGAALAAALRVARGLRHGVVVTVFPDSGDKYLSERFWDSRVEDSPAMNDHERLPRAHRQE